MQIAATELKSLLKRLVGKSDVLFLDFDAGRLITQDPELTIAVQSDLLKSKGVYCVNARKFTTVVNRMSGSIEITGGKTLTLKSAKAKVEIELLSGKPPAIGVPKNLKTLPLATVQSLLQYAATASTDNKAAETGGVVQLSLVKGGGFTAAGTDTKRLAFTEAATDNYGDPVTYLIPLPAVEALGKLEGSEFQMSESESHFYFADARITIFARKLSKNFPDYASFLPKTFAFVATVDSAAFKEALRLVEPMVPDEGARPVTVHFLDGVLTVSAGSGGSAQDELPYTQTVADPVFDLTEFKTRLAFPHLLGFVQSVAGNILFQGNSNEAPVVLEAGNRKLMAAAVVGGA